MGVAVVVAGIAVAGTAVVGIAAAAAVVIDMIARCWMGKRVDCWCNH